MRHLPQLIHDSAKAKVGPSLYEGSSTQEVWTGGLSKIESISDETHEKGRLLLGSTPFADNFTITVDGIKLIPVRHNGYVDNNRGVLRRWLLTYNTDSPQYSPFVLKLQLLLTPELFEDGDPRKPNYRYFYQYRDVKKKGGKGSFIERHYPEDSDGYIAVDEPGVTQARLAALFPSSQISHHGNYWLVRVPNRKPAYHEATYPQNFGSELRYKHEIKGEKQDAGLGLATPLLDRIRKFGKIVYDNSSPEADRTIICVKHIHGNRVTHYLFSQLNNGLTSMIQAHSKKVIEFIKDTGMLIDSSILHHVEESTSRFLLNDEVQLQAMKEGAIVHNLLLNSNEKSLLVTKIFLYIHKNFAPTSLTKPDIREILFSYIDPSTFTYEMMSNLGNISHLHGDGRTETVEKIKQKIDEITRSFAIVLSATNQAGVASDYHALTKEKQKLILDDPHKVIAEELAGKLETGHIAFVTYGGGHFASGLCNSEQEATSLLEGYLNTIPRTRVIVVEDNDYLRVDTEVHRFYQSMEFDSSGKLRDTATLERLYTMHNLIGDNLLLSSLLFRTYVIKEINQIDSSDTLHFLCQTILNVRDLKEELKKELANG